MTHNHSKDGALQDPQLGNTFGGFLSAGADGSELISTGPMQLTSARASKTQMMSVSGLADVYASEQTFVNELKAQVASRTDKAAHAAFWSTFWNHSDITITNAATPQTPAIAAAASRVTLLDKVNRAAFYSMAMGRHAIKFNAYGIYSAYPNGQEDYRVWGACQWFQNIRLPYVNENLSINKPTGIWLMDLKNEGRNGVARSGVLFKFVALPLPCMLMGWRSNL